MVKLVFNSIKTVKKNKNKNSVTDAEQQTQQRRIQYMYTPCDVLKALIKECRAWGVIDCWRPLSPQNCQFVWSGEVYIRHRKVLAHKGLLTEQ